MNYQQGRNMKQVERKKDKQSIKKNKTNLIEEKNVEETEYK